MIGLKSILKIKPEQQEYDVNSYVEKIENLPLGKDRCPNMKNLRIDKYKESIKTVSRLLKIN